MSRIHVILKRTGKLLKFAVFCLLAAIIILLIWRLFTTSVPDSLQTVIPNDKLKAAYAQKGENLYIFEQEYDTITRADNNAGYFSIEQAHFIPDANQTQVVFRYNNSTIKHLATDYELDEVPNREQELFDVSLVYYIDLTPENQDDNFLDNSDFSNSSVEHNIFINPETTTAIRIHHSSKKAEKTNIYNFYKYVFELGDEADLATLIKENKLIAVQAEVYYNQDINFKKSDLQKTTPHSRVQIAARKCYRWVQAREIIVLFVFGPCTLI